MALSWFGKCIIYPTVLFFFIGLIFVGGFTGGIVLGTIGFIIGCVAGVLLANLEGFVGAMFKK